MANNTSHDMIHLGTLGNMMEYPDGDNDSVI
jgi:hypothetical protein